MSERTTAQPKQNTAPTVTPTFGATLQRKCACGGTPGPSGECAECSKKRLALQAKLTIGQPNDPYEQEADHVADVVMRMPDPKVQRQPDDAGVVQAKPIASQITPLVQTQATPNHTPEVTPAMEANINALKGGGQPLDPATRAFMEPRFGHEFSQVRVHTDAKATESARVLNARAFAVGQNIVFGAGYFQPGTAAGKELLAHELTHVIQHDQNQIRKSANDESTLPACGTKWLALIIAGVSLLVALRAAGRIPIAILWATFTSKLTDLIECYSKGEAEAEHREEMERVKEELKEQKEELKKQREQLDNLNNEMKKTESEQEKHQISLEMQDFILELIKEGQAKTGEPPL